MLFISHLSVTSSYSRLLHLLRKCMWPHESHPSSHCTSSTLHCVSLVFSYLHHMLMWWTWAGVEARDAPRREETTNNKLNRLNAYMPYHSHLFSNIQIVFSDFLSWAHKIALGVSGRSAEALHVKRRFVSQALNEHSRFKGMQIPCWRNRSIDRLTWAPKLRLK